MSLTIIWINQRINHKPLESWCLFWYICNWYMFSRSENHDEVLVSFASVSLTFPLTPSLCPSEMLSWYSVQLLQKRVPRISLRGQEAGMSMEETADCSHGLRKWGVCVSVPAGAVASCWRGQDKLSHIWQLEQVNKFMGSCDDLLSVFLAVARHYWTTTSKYPHLRQEKWRSKREMEKDMERRVRDTEILVDTTRF